MIYRYSKIEDHHTGKFQTQTKHAKHSKNQTNQRLIYSLIFFEFDKFIGRKKKTFQNDNLKRLC